LPLLREEDLFGSPSLLLGRLLFDPGAGLVACIVDIACTFLDEDHARAVLPLVFVFVDGIDRGWRLLWRVKVDGSFVS
jgi:hypothetical protein